MVMDMIRVLVVDDSIFMRNIISDMISENNNIEIVGRARNGKEAVELNIQLKPDVITMDVEMPVMNGLEALKKIMSDRPTKVIMVSSLTKEGAKETIEALNNGAFDFVPKPSGQISLDIRTVKEDLISKIKASVDANLKILKKNTEEKDIDSGKIRLKKFIKEHETENNSKNKKIVVIGISTGGPKALQSVIPNLPAEIGAPVLVVQHMPPKFTKSLADRLDVLSNVRVKEAEDGDKIKDGFVYIAPGDYHMTVKQEGNERVIRLNQQPPFSGHRPSANVMFDSVADIYKSNIIGVIMTGMGGDGAEKLKKIRDCGGRTIGQSKDSCVVYGMPRVAAELGAVEFVEDLEQIPDKIMYLLKQNSREE
jgi:two-component system, chemotaxis family, protein-glutamate methylesterase/glutaminase